MSASNIEKFCQLSQSNHELSESLQTLLKNLDRIDVTSSEILQVAEEIVRLGADYGLSFTVSELFDYLETKSRYLTDEELEQVAGGIGKKAMEIGVSAMTILSLGTGALSFFSQQNKADIIAPERTSMVLTQSSGGVGQDGNEELNARITENRTHKGGTSNWKELFSNYDNYGQKKNTQPTSQAL